MQQAIAKLKDKMEIFIFLFIVAMPALILTQWIFGLTGNISVAPRIIFSIYTIMAFVVSFRTLFDKTKRGLEDALVSFTIYIAIDVIPYLIAIIVRYFA